DVAGIGNAIVDVIAPADEAFLGAQRLAKGTMTLIDAERAHALYGEMGPAIESSGGSAGNTMAGIATLGGRGGYIGKVRDDLLGEVFRHDITAIGVKFDTPAATEGPGTARCLVMVTPGGQRAIAALTRSEHGSVILADGAAHRVAAHPVARVVDSTGAGDLYAAGFLYGLTRGLALPICGAVGSLCAAEIISHVGARPEAALDQ